MMSSHHPLPSSNFPFSSSSSSSRQEIPHPLLHDSPPTPSGPPSLSPTSISNPSSSSSTSLSTITTATLTNFHHQPFELLHWSTTANPITTPQVTTATSSSPTSFLSLNSLDNSDQINLFLSSQTTQPTSMAMQAELSPSPIALPPMPSSSSSPQSSSSSPSSQQNPHAPLDHPTQSDNKMINILPFSTHDNFPSKSSIMQSNLTTNHPSSSLCMDNHVLRSRPSTAPTVSFWSNPNITNLQTPINNPPASTTTELGDPSFNDPFKAFSYQPHQNLPSSGIPNFNQLIPPSQVHQPHPSMLINPPQELMIGNDPVPPATYHSSPHSPPRGRLISHNQVHHHRPRPIYQHPYNSLGSIPSPADHQSFPLPIYHAHPHLGGWHAGFDPVHQTSFSDPFQIKHRRRTSPTQLNVLEAQFQTNCKPDVSLRKQLADQLGMSVREVQVWFQNRRAKTKKLEKRAEQESGKSTEPDTIPNPSQSTASPPASVYLSSPSHRGLALPITHESPEEARIGVSPPRFISSAVKPTGEIEEVDTINLPTGMSTSNPFIGTRTHNQHQQYAECDDSLAVRRSSHTSMASTATATDSNLVCTPTTAEFGSESATEFPDGYDSRRRASCPAEFIQSFDQFGLAINQLPDRSAQPGPPSSFIATHQISESMDKPTLDSNFDSFTIPEDHHEGWVGQHGYRNDAVREGIQRRHSLATMTSPIESHGHSDGQVPSTQLNTNDGFSSLFSMGTTGYPAPNLTGIDNNHVNGIKSNATRGGYARRASTSVLKAIEEHPGNV